MLCYTFFCIAKECYTMQYSFVLSYTFHRKLKSTAHKRCFSDTFWTPFSPHRTPNTALWVQGASVDINRFPFLQPISYKLPSENRDSNNLLWSTKQQRLLLEEGSKLKEQVPTAFAYSGTQVERKNLTTLQ